MSLFEQLKQDLKSNRKTLVVESSKETASKVSILRLLVSEFDTKGTDTPDQSDEAIYKKIREFMDSNKLVMERNVDGSEKYTKAEVENAILSGYLPKQLSEEEMTEEMTSIVKEYELHGMADMKTMKEKMDERFPNQYDKKLFGKLGKAVLK